MKRFRFGRKPVRSAPYRAYTRTYTVFAGHPVDTPVTAVEKDRLIVLLNTHTHTGVLLLSSW